MSLFTQPLVGLSLTEPDRGLLRYASMVASLGDCKECRFIHVITTDSADTVARPEASLRDLMAAEVAEHFKADGVEPVFEVVHGTRLDQLLDAAIRNKNDLIVLGHRRGRSGRRSLARRLTMIAPCSVWLVPQDSPAELDTIVVPVDFSPPSADALSIGVNIAAARKLRSCLAVHVFFDQSTIRYDEHVTEVIGREQHAFEEFAAGIDDRGVRIEPLFEESTHPDQAILRVVHRHQADLIVMSTRGRSKAAAVLLGSVTSATMMATTVPILAVKHFGARMGFMESLLSHQFWSKESPKTN